jgi:hypothetical protein
LENRIALMRAACRSLIGGLAYPLPVGFGVVIRRTAFRGAGLLTLDAAGRGHRAPAAAAAGCAPRSGISSAAMRRFCSSVSSARSS